jgi:cell division protein FtsI/penicillin-binding protein 2
MNPYNGDILPMASYPTFDPNLPLERGQDPKPRMNHAISVPFEPGSVYKVVTLSAALETTNLRPESPINCNGGRITFGSRTIHDSHGGLGVVPMATVLAKSSNVGAIQVGWVASRTCTITCAASVSGRGRAFRYPGSRGAAYAAWSAGARLPWRPCRWARK